MKEFISYVIKMENDEYLITSQEDDDTVFGWTTKDVKLASEFTIDEVEEIIEALIHHKKLSGTSYGEIHKDVFTLQMSKNRKPKSYIKVITTIDEEIEIL
jgi:hypothetical protein